MDFKKMEFGKKHFPDVDVRDLYRCVSCGNCRSVCPVFEEEKWESSNTRGRILIARSLYEGAEAEKEVFDSINTCTTCGYCTETCPAGANPPEIVEGIRKGLVEMGKMTPVQKKIHDTVTNFGNTLGEAGSRRSWLPDNVVVPEKADAVYFVGCMDSYRYKETAAKTYGILNKIGVGLLENETCCGSPLLRIGFNADALIRHNRKEIEKTGANTIVAGCAGCYNTLKTNYPDIQVLSVSDYIEKNLETLKKEGLKKLDMSVSYHDPCHLGRHNKVYESPRNIIREICTLKEMKNIKEASRCCGGGGGVRAGFNELSLAMAKRRWQDVAEDVDILVTTCPLCVRNLRDASEKKKVIDIIDLITLSMENAKNKQ